MARSKVKLNGTAAVSSSLQCHGSLLLIGGHEEKEGHRVILQRVAKHAAGGRLVVVTVASEEPEPQWHEYRKTFAELGLRDVVQLDARRRDELTAVDSVEALKHAKVVFFAGGDQMRITSKFGGTPLCDAMRELYQKGALIAGTSSGASVLSEVMMAGGESDASHDDRDHLRLSAGLGLMQGVIIDQHFAERGRIGRLLGAVAQNARLLGIGIDENTALLIENSRNASVLGSGAVYILDAREMTYTSCEGNSATMSAFGLRMHVLSESDRFDLETRIPESRPQGNGTPKTC
jgi:cyanophycinase